MSLDRNADPAAMAARIKELEAAQAAHASTPQTPMAAVLAVGTSIMGLFPKWLIAAALAVFLGFHAFSYYQQARQMAAETARIEVESAAKTTVLRNSPFADVGDAMPASPGRPPVQESHTRFGQPKVLGGN